MPVQVPPAAAECFEAVLGVLDAADQARVEALAAAIALPAAKAETEPDFAAPARVVDAALALPPGQARDRLRRGLVARWALDLPALVDVMGLPPEIVQLVPDALSRLASFLTGSDGPYDEDFWAKDVRFVLGLTVPAGAQVVDLYARVGPGEVLRHSLSRREPGAVLAFARAGGWGPWLQMHTDSRCLGQFNPDGLDAVYCRVAAILKTRPAARGLIGSSWFYDPPLTQISPRLAFLRERPLAGGAVFVHQGPGETYTARCIETSPTRRKLVEEGRYTPRSWMMIWPREALIRWAETGAPAGVQAAA